MKFVVVLKTNYRLVWLSGRVADCKGRIVITATHARWLAAVFAMALWSGPGTAAQIPAARATIDLPADNYVHAQRLVAVDHARRLNILCVGQGAPTVLLEAGSGGSTLDWRHVQGRIALTTRVCSYDRAGYGFSDPATRVSDVRNTVDDLHRLIEAAHVGPHAVLVGHSNGGLYVVAYVERYPKDVGGLVLVDPGYPGQQNYAAYGLGSVRAEALHNWAEGLVSTQARCVALARDGKINSTDGEGTGCSDTPAGLDVSIREALHRIYSGVPYQAANLSEFKSSFEAINGVTADDREVNWPLQSLGAMPLAVLTAARHPAPISGFSPIEQARFWAVWKAGHDHLATLSTAARSVVVQGSGHFIQNDQPDIVTAWTEAVVTAVRTESVARVRHN